MHAYRSHTCAELNSSNVGDTVRLSGWVHRVRDHGGVLFIDLRDHYGMTQVLCDPDRNLLGCDLRVDLRRGNRVRFGNICRTLTP